MKKEVLIAIIIGFGLGLVITFGIWMANKSLKESAPEKTAPLTQETPTSQPEKIELSLILDSPQDGLVYDQSTIQVEGVSAPKVVVVILYPEGEKILEADEQGKFETEIELDSGINEIKISAYDQNGNQVEKTLTVVYSTAEI